MTWSSPERFKEWQGVIFQKALLSDTGLLDHSSFKVFVSGFDMKPLSYRIVDSLIQVS